MCRRDGCSRTVFVRGWCRLHYGRVQRTGAPGPADYLVRRKKPDERCDVVDCERSTDHRGLCALHYQRLLKEGAVGPVQARRVRAYAADAACQVAQCAERPIARGFCSPHYQRWSNHGDPLGGASGPSIRKVVDFEDGSRLCTRCGLRVPLEGFDRDANASLGRRSQCKSCRGKHVADWYQQNLDRQRSRATARRARDGEAIRRSDRDRYERDKPKRLAIASVAADRRRARLAQVDFDKTVTRPALRRRYGDHCHYCGVEMIFAVFKRGTVRPDNLATLEHIVPISSGGAHSWTNVVLACWRCNISKNRKLIAEWSGPKEMTCAVEAEEGSPSD